VPAESSLHRHCLADSTLPPGASLFVTTWRTHLASPGASLLPDLLLHYSAWRDHPAARRPAHRVTTATGL